MMGKELTPEATRAFTSPLHSARSYTAGLSRSEQYAQPARA
jgi:hypothetical protein